MSASHEMTIRHLQEVSFLHEITKIIVGGGATFGEFNIAISFGICIY